MCVRNGSHGCGGEGVFARSPPSSGVSRENGVVAGIGIPNRGGETLECETSSVNFFSRLGREGKMGKKPALFHWECLQKSSDAQPTPTPKKEMKNSALHLWLACCSTR